MADGVGGGAFGDVASSALLRHCAQASPEIYRNADRLVDWLRKADAVVREAVNRRGGGPGASMLVAVWLLADGQVQLVHVGDCRAYRLSPLADGLVIDALTEDQTYAHLSIAPPANRKPDDPVRMVGVGAVGTPPVRCVQCQAGDWLLLCSDGLHKYLADNAIAALCHAGAQQGKSLQQISCALVDAAKANGSDDDISVLLARRDALSRWRTFWQAMLRWH